MQKIPTMFVRDESKPGHPVTDRIKPECQWVLDGEGDATVKLDGTNVKVEGGALYKRQKPKTGDYDDAAYIPCDRANPADRWAWEAFDSHQVADGVYELIGPKVQGNPHHLPSHELVRVVPPDQALGISLIAFGRTFKGIKLYLSETAIEGIVFHHPDGRMAKIKRRDFGLQWPAIGATPHSRGSTEPHDDDIRDLEARVAQGELLSDRENDRLQVAHRLP